MEISETVIIETIGIIAFAMSGATVAAKKNFDIFGIIVLGVMTAVGGGALRDIILGINPPAMFRNPFYVLIAFMTCLVAFVIFSLSVKKNLKSRKHFMEIVNFFDAVGLGMFAVTGTNTAILNGYVDKAFLAIFVGVITGIGGGMIRDMMAAKVPFVLYKDIYAMAAVAGASIYYYMHIFGIKEIFSVSFSVIITILIRLAATYFKLRLPRLTDMRKKP